MAWVHLRLWQSRSGGWEGTGGRKHRLCPGGSVEKGRGWRGSRESSAGPGAPLRLGISMSAGELQSRRGCRSR